MYYTFLTSTVLWAAQLLLITFRLASIADFQFLDLVVKMKTANEANSPKDKDEVEEEQVKVECYNDNIIARNISDHKFDTYDIGIGKLFLN